MARVAVVRKSPALALAALLFVVVAVPGQASHSQTQPNGDIVRFTQVSGNEWWVQVRMAGADGPSASSVLAMDTGGGWVALKRQTWTADGTWWAGSFRIEAGHQVRFSASFPDGVSNFLSCWFDHPSGVEQCGTAPPPPPPPPPPTVLKEAEAFATRTAGGAQAQSSASGGTVWNLWSNGHIQDSLAGDGSATLTVRARGTPLGSVWPSMTVSVDGSVVRTVSVASTSLADYPIGTLASGAHAVKVAFTNDALSGSEDRNLILDVVKLVGSTSTTPDATVTVRTTATGGPIDPRIYSFNVVSWEPADWNPANPTFVGMLKQLDPALLRFPPGHDGQYTYFDPTNTRTTPPAGYTRLLRADALDQFVATSRQTGAEPMIEVNLKTGTPEMAASLVRYLNVQKGYDVTWFELGNEPDLSDKYRTDPTTEGHKFLRYAEAMRAVDPSIQLVGGSIMTGANAFGTNGRTPWLQPFANTVGTNADALSWHWYPLDSEQPSTTSSAYPSVAHLLQETAPDWRTAGLDFAELACAKMETLRSQTGAEHWVTEMGPDSGAKQAPGITNGQVAAVWFADALPRLAECGADAVFQFAVRQQAGSVLVLMTHDRQPTPGWGTYQLMANNYEGTWLPVDKTGPSKLAAHAARSDDGRLSVILANKGSSPLRVDVDMGAATQAKAWTLEADTPTSTKARVNGAPLDRTAVLAGFPAVTQSLATPVLVPAYGVVMLEAA